MVVMARIGSRSSRIRIPSWVGLLGCALLVALPGACSDPGGTAEGGGYDASGRATHGAKRLASPPNLILVVIDSLRADALPAPGDEGTSLPMPFLASLAREGLSLTEATASSSWTLPSMASLLTGLLPHAHGQVRVDPDARLPEAVTTYPEVLRETHGYETAAFVNGPWFRSGPESVLQGFSHVGPGAFSLQAYVSGVAAWNDRRDRERPFFLLLHTFDAHFPYGSENHPWPPRFRQLPPAPHLLHPRADPADLTRVCLLDVEGRMGLGRALGESRLSRTVQRYLYEGYPAHPRPALADDLRTAYWEGVQWTDGLLRDAYAWFERQGMLENTVFVVTSDHGEAFGEHGSLTHGLMLYDEVVRIPMVWTGPPPFQGGTVFTAGGGLIDVLPTFCDFAGIHPLLPGTGRSLLPLLAEDDACLPAVAEERLTFDNTGCDVDLSRASVRTPEWKYILTYDYRTGTVREEAYDLLIDGAETDDLGGGSGLLPEDLRFDACECPAVEAVRTALWGRTGVAHEGYSTPYGTMAPHVRTKRPLPCTRDAE